MGNSHSSIEVAPRRSAHKLSKPRIGNPATAGLLSPNGLSTSTVRFSNSPLTNKALPLEPVLPPLSPITATSVTALELSADPPEEPAADDMVEGPGIQKKESRRRSLFRSLSYQKATSKSTRRTSSVGPSPRPTAAEKLGRAQSMTAEVTHIAYYAAPSAENWSSRSAMGSRRTSWNYDMNSYEAKRLLNLLEEPAFEQAATVSDRNTVVSEATWKSSNPINPPQASSTPITRANSDLSLYTPVRRRSIIQTPGVATRTRTMTSTAPPKTNFRYSHPPTPSMSRQQSFESMRSGVISMPPRILDPDSMPRVVTPSEQDYKSIGAFKLGSLRITNGAASPVSPELEKKGKHGEPNSSVTRERADYFSVTPVAQGETVEPLDDKTHTIVASQPRASNLSPIAASFMEAEAARAPSDVVVKHSSPKLIELPERFLAEISFTPFSLTDSRPLSPELQTTSKHTAIEDDLFDDDANLEYSTVEVLDVRLDLNAKSQVAESQLDTQFSLRSVSRTDSGFVSAGSPSSEAPLKPLTKADSGYSSNVSLRSFTTSKSHAADNEFTQILDKHISTSGPSAVGEQQPLTPVWQSLERPPQPQREPPPPPVPPKDSVPTSPSRISGSSALNKALSGLREARLSTPSSSGKSRHTPSPINSMRSNETGPGSPSSMPRTPPSARSDVSTSALSIGSGSNRPSKLQRLLSGARRNSHGPPMVHVTHALDKAVIPSIPQEVETKLHEHTGLFPMTTKRLALKPQQSKDTLKTIFSVGSMEISLDAMNPTRTASPALTDDMDDHDESHARHLVHSVQHSLAHAAAHIIPRKPVARKPIPIPRASAVRMESRSTQDAENETMLAAEAELASYSSISSSLGNNPYDAAVMAMGEKTGGLPSPPAMAGRTMSLTASVERKLYMNVRKMPSASSLVDRQGIALPSPLLPREPIAVQPKKTKTPPPVSMMTRPNGSLRVPRSLRHHKSAQSLSRKSSRDSIQSYPAAVPPVQPSLSRRSSRENVQSYPSYQQAPPPIREQVLSPPPIPRMDPRRSMSLRGQNHPQGMSAPYRAPNWDPQVQNGLSRRSSMSSMDSGSRNDSFSSSRSHQSIQLQRPASTQPYQGRPNQPLRHRASYDGYSNGINRGHPPSMSNGYTAPAPTKPIIDPRWNSNRQPAQVKQDQYGVYPPHVPRGHHRNRSVGNHGYPVNAPYRVLHSYNSPAYRNVPIWG
ncbi:hypothetical protein CONLIGDRAFT_291610 [Coniochaeta ligniaria NRRL 30616]|uniref:Uncharacterized protein n=1 Tax=Coniochaeta ligniaria NRRL 30616 TaxID=1408157 RepID=A0A1J7ITM3_9PEZI|nr:hypothetical protein CONLIGDRAFT_291610 [Coniochaeta ligniaria NRRL 30616]